MSLQAMYEDLDQSLIEGTAIRGLTRPEFEKLKADLKQRKFGVSMKYITTPKYAHGAFTIRLTKKERAGWNEERFNALMSYLIAEGYFARQISLEKMQGNPLLWSNDVKFHGLHHIFRRL